MRIFTTLGLSLLFSTFSFSQIIKAEILKKYVIKDSTLSNKEAYLLLCKNNVFINYGIYNNKKELEWYIWYTSGTYQLVGEKIVCNSIPNKNDNQLIKDIKNSYKRRSDHILIMTEYEFVNEKYTDYTFKVESNKVSDSSRKLEYFETN